MFYASLFVFSLFVETILSTTLFLPVYIFLHFFRAFATIYLTFVFAQGTRCHVQDILESAFLLIPLM